MNRMSVSTNHFYLKLKMSIFSLFSKLLSGHFFTTRMTDSDKTTVGINKIFCNFAKESSLMLLLQEK